MCTHRAQRLARKRAARVPLATGGFTTRRRAREYVAAHRARFNERGELEFLPESQRHQVTYARLVMEAYDPFDVFAFHWYRADSGGCEVMKGKAGTCA